MFSWLCVCIQPFKTQSVRTTFAISFCLKKIAVWEKKLDAKVGKWDDRDDEKSLVKRKFHEQNPKLVFLLPLIEIHLKNIQPNG